MLGLVVSGAIAQSKTEEIDRLMQHCADNDMFNGTIIVSENGNVIYRKGLGVANRETKEELTPKSAFYLASVAKQFTAMAIMILKEQGKLEYNDKLSTYFPGFKPYAETVTIRQLMNHTSGIADHFQLGLNKEGLTNADVLERLLKQDTLGFKSGTRFSYSNGGYVLLALIVEKVAETPFHIFMKDNIFKPLRMKNTQVFDESKPQIKNRVTGYSNGELDDYNILTTGAGGIYSTVDDLHLWDQALYSEKLISQKALVAAFTPASLNSGEISPYGFGWLIKGEEESKTVEHSGGLSGFRTTIKRYLNENNAYFYLTSNGDALAMHEIKQALENILSDAPYELPKIRISNYLANTLKSESIEAAITGAKKMLADHPEMYVVDEAGVNALGYMYLRDNNLKLALSIFEFNCEMNPNSSNVFDSMGEAFLTNKDTVLSIENYKKSIALNPSNVSGIEVLKNLGVDESTLNPTIVVPEEILESYVGNYELAPNFVLSISRKENRLYIQATGQAVSEVFPTSNSRFYSKIVNAQITFNKNKSGVVESLTLHQGGDTIAKKL